jgi:hypothetical protein
MSCSAFRRLSLVVQLYWVLKYGTFLAKRWEADDDGVNLYHCADEGRGGLWPRAANRTTELREQCPAGGL